MLSLIPIGYNLVDIVAHSYFQNSIKDAERAKQGTSQSIFIKSAKSKVPNDFSKFLSCGQNKTRLIKLIFETLQTDRNRALRTIKSNSLVLSREDECKLVTSLGISEFDTLLSKQEEADTKVVGHAVEYLKQSDNHNVIIRSHSGDTDIIIICLSLLVNEKDRVIIDSGCGKSRKLIYLGGVDLSPARCSALIGLHAFTGNDYLSCFSAKVKI